MGTRRGSRVNTFNPRNYTSKVPPARTAERIEAFLAEAGASHIAKNYSNNQLVGIDFAIDVQPGIQLAFRLPVDVEAMRAYLISQRRTSLTHVQRKAINEQAARTAWRLMQDWVETQLSLVATKQAELAQVFMPYAWNGNQTFYQSVKGRGFAQLAAPKSEVE